MCDLTVGSLLGKDAASCQLPWHATLKVAAEMLANSGCTAAAVLDDANEVLGLLTENDLVRAYFEGASREVTVGDWLQGGAARAPAGVLQRLAVRPAQSVREAARRMAENIAAGDIACHHLIVRGDDGSFGGILSALSLARALLISDVGGADPATRAADRTVRDAMKSCDEVFTCHLRYSMKQIMRVMLVTRENSVLIADNDGISAIVTPRDALLAFIEGFPNFDSITDRLSRKGSQEERLIASDARLSDACSKMTACSLHHLVVVQPQTSETVGVLSALDMVLSSQLHALPHRPFAARFALHSPVADIVKQVITPVCSVSSTLGHAGDLLAAQQCTAAVLVDESGATKGVLTVNDIMHAYLDGWSHDDGIRQWLSSDASALPRHATVRPVVPVTEVATMMLVNHWRLGSCHHLLVMGDDGRFYGVLSSLDIVRAMCTLASGLNVLESGAPVTTVAMVAKLNLANEAPTVPFCKCTDTIAHAFRVLIESQQDGVLIADGNTIQGIITPRCAMEAFNAGISHDSTVACLLHGRHTRIEPREVAPEARLLDAAEAMVSRNLQHLVVVTSGTNVPMGLISSLDVVRGIASITAHCKFVSLRWLRSCQWAAGRQDLGGA